jgi:uncharacterized RDD family membrane protein YckC
VEERLDIDTPENVVFDYQVAGIGSRFIAALIDTLILSITLFVFNCGAVLLAGLAFDSGLDSWVVALYGLLIFASIWGYYIFFEMVWNGQSPGKRRAGLRVVRTDGTPITLVDSLIRNLVRIIDFLPLYYAVGTVTMFLNSQARRLGDYAAGTLVVKEQRDVTLESIQRALNTGVAIPDAAALFELSESDYQLMGDFLSRRHELHNRDELAQRIATAVAAKLGLPRPSSAKDAEELLTRLARQSRRQ